MSSSIKHALKSWQHAEWKASKHGIAIVDMCHYKCRYKLLMINWARTKVCITDRDVKNILMTVCWCVDCWAIDCSLSRMTLRSWRMSICSTMTEQCCLSFIRLDREPNHINSLLFGSNYSWHDEYQILGCLKQSSSQRRRSATASHCICISAASRRRIDGGWRLTCWWSLLSSIDDESVWPMTEPCGTSARKCHWEKFSIT